MSALFKKNNKINNLNPLNGVFVCEHDDSYDVDVYDVSFYDYRVFACVFFYSRNRLRNRNSLFLYFKPLFSNFTRS